MPNSVCIESSMGIPFEEKVIIKTDGGLGLEGILHYSDATMRPTPVLIVSPHPCFAGTMENNVIKAMAYHLSAEGYMTLRFNYPGIGLSDPPDGLTDSAFDYWDRMEKEQNHVPGINSIIAASNFLRNIHGQHNGVLMVGYSYGAMLALLAACEQGRTAAVAAIATPWRKEYDFSWLADITCPTLLLSGEKDFVWNRDVWNEAWRRLPDSKSRLLLDDDHFFRGTEQQLLLPVSDFFQNIENKMEYS